MSSSTANTASSSTTNTASSSVAKTEQALRDINLTDTKYKLNTTGEKVTGQDKKYDVTAACDTHKFAREQVRLAMAFLDDAHDEMARLMDQVETAEEEVNQGTILLQTVLKKLPLKTVRDQHKDGARVWARADKPA